MTKPFFPTTAEHIVLVVEAVIANGKDSHVDFVASFSNLLKDQAENALRLASDMALLELNGNLYRSKECLSKYMCSSDASQRAMILRIFLESYEPFRLFRERLTQSNSVDTSAHQTRTLLDLDAPPAEIRDTLINLGTYAGIFNPAGGGIFKVSQASIPNILVKIGKACGERLAAEKRIREQIGVAAVSKVSSREVIEPLSIALIKATLKQPKEAVVFGGKAVESYLSGLASRMNVDITAATGINSILDVFRATKMLPKKVVYIGKYLGHIRNAAGHGVDPELQVSWDIRENTAFEYVFVACSFIAACTSIENRAGYII